MTEQEQEERERADWKELHDAVFAAFVAWAGKRSWPVDGWTMGADGYLRTPQDGACSFYEACKSLQRIEEMRALGASELVRVMAELPVAQALPAQLTREGRPALTLFALFDGNAALWVETSVDDLTPPAAAAVLIGLEGETRDEAQWVEPLKLYQLLEYGYKLTPTQEDIPF